MAAALRINNPGSIGPGDNLLVSWAGVDNPTSRDWIGVWPGGQVDAEDGSNRVVRKYTSGASSGNLFLPLPADLLPGGYDVRLMWNDTSTMLAQTTIQVQPVISTPPGEPAPTPTEPAAPTPATAAAFDLAALLQNPLVLVMGAVVLGRMLGVIGGRR